MKDSRVSTGALGFLRLRYYNQESKCQKRLSDVTAISRIVVIALAAFFDCYSPHEASSVELPRLSGMVNDFSSSLQVAYVKDLEVRLRRFNEKTGYAIIVVVIPSGEDEQISNFIAQIFVNNGLEQWGLGGTVLVLITIQEGWVIAEPSQKVEKKFLKVEALNRINDFFPGEFQYREAAIERRVEAVLEILDPWIYGWRDLNGVHFCRKVASVRKIFGVWLSRMCCCTSHRVSCETTRGHCTGYAVLQRWS